MVGVSSVLQQQLVHLSCGLGSQDFLGDPEHSIGAFHQLFLLKFYEQPCPIFHQRTGMTNNLKRTFY
jgi:hypothetical protein